MSKNEQSAVSDVAADDAANTAAAPDLASFDGLSKAQEDGIDVPILHPTTGEEIGIVIRVCGPDSERQRKAVQKQVDDRLRRRSAKPMTGAEVTEAGVRTVVACVLGWNHVVLDGRDVPFSVDNAVSLFQRFPWIFEQVNMAAGDRASFLKS